MPYLQLEVTDRGQHELQRMAALYELPVEELLNTALCILRWTVKYRLDGCTIEAVDWNAERLTELDLAFFQKLDQLINTSTEAELK